MFERTTVKDVISLMAFVAILIFARASLADHYVVPTSSMVPTVNVGDRLIVNKLAYGLRLPLTEIYVIETNGPQHGDVVVLDSPEESKVLLKRVVALPGEEVSVRAGRLVIDGEEIPTEIAETKITEDLLGKRHSIALTRGGGPYFGPVRIPDRQYLVMGDNRGESYDGRFFGFVNREAILGRSVAIYWSDGRPTWTPL